MHEVEVEIDVVSTASHDQTIEVCAGFAPSTEVENIQFFLLCGCPHKRKAWLFADSSQGAKASAVCYSIVETAKLNGLEPYEYLHTILTNLPYAETVEQIESLLPWNIAKA